MSSVQIGEHSLALGGPGGTLIEPGGGDGADPAALAEALEHPRIGPVAKQVVDAAEEATARAEETVDLTRAFLEGTLGDLSKASGRIDVILSVLERLDRNGDHKEALELARAVNGLLALFYRWSDLVRSLGIARRAAEGIDDLASVAWVEHELGTLQLAAGNPGEGVRHLCEARRIRREHGLDGLEATEANLGTFCRQLRGTGRPPRWRRLLVAAGGLLLLLLGGAIGAVLASDDEPPAIGTALLTVEREGEGRVVSVPAGIDCPDTCDRRFVRRTRIVLTPDAADGWTFMRWEGRCDGREPCSFRLRGDRTVRAVFAEEEGEPTPTVTLTVDPPTGGTVVSELVGIDCPEACEVDVDEDEPVTLTAHQGEGFLFTGWGGACAGQEGPCKLDMAGDRQVSATFVEAQTISVAVEGPGTVRSDPEGIACPGVCEAQFPASEGTVTLTATGETFARWSSPCARQQAPTCEMTLGVDDSVTAFFNPTPTPTATPEPEPDIG
jgi:Divergent InlB B-repeat domain